MRISPCHGIWEGVLSGSAEAPVLEVLPGKAGARGIGQRDCRTSGGVWCNPGGVLSEGVQTFLRNAATGDKLQHFTVITGVAMEDDLRAEVDLLRAELDMLKRRLPPALSGNHGLTQRLAQRWPSRSGLGAAQDAGDLELDVLDGGLDLFDRQVETGAEGVDHFVHQHFGCAGAGGQADGAGPPARASRCRRRAAPAWHRRSRRRAPPRPAAWSSTNWARRSPEARRSGRHRLDGGLAVGGGIADVVMRGRLDRGNRAFSAAAISAVSSTDRVVWVMKASFAGSRTCSRATSATVSTSSTSPGGSWPMVPMVSGWPSWPM
jgi:hypothetical protein